MRFIVNISTCRQYTCTYTFIVGKYQIYLYELQKKKNPLYLIFYVYEYRTGLKKKNDSKIFRNKLKSIVCEMKKIKYKSNIIHYYYYHYYYYYDYYYYYLLLLLIL